MKYYFPTRLVIFFLVSLATISASSPPVPYDKAELNKWFTENVKPYADRTAELDKELVEAEKNATVVKVRADGSGDFKTVTEAINSVPEKNTKRVIIWIGGGVYKEKLKIDRHKPFVTLYGSPNDMPTLTFNRNAKKYGTVYSATLIVESNYFVAANLIIEALSTQLCIEQGVQSRATYKLLKIRTKHWEIVEGEVWKKKGKQFEAFMNVDNLVKQFEILLRNSHDYWEYANKRDEVILKAPEFPKQILNSKESKAAMQKIRWKSRSL